MSDLISRQAAIKELDHALWGKEWDKALAKAMLESLPSVQPVQVLTQTEGTAKPIAESSQNVQNDDLISRKAAIEGTKRIPDLTVYAFCSFIDMLTNMPSVQPERKKGKWILTEDDDYEYCTCSECGYQNGENWMNGSDIPFCAMCGADMIGEEE